MNHLKDTYQFKLKLAAALPMIKVENIDGDQDVKLNAEDVESDAEEENDRPYRCKICYKTFKTKENFESHFERHSTKPRQYRCKRCRLCFLMMKNFNDHVCKPHSKKISNQ